MAYMALSPSGWARCSRGAVTTRTSARRKAPSASGFAPNAMADSTTFVVGSAAGDNFLSDVVPDAV